MSIRATSESHTGHDINDCIEELESDIIFDATRGFDRYNLYTPVVRHTDLLCT